MGIRNLIDGVAVDFFAESAKPWYFVLRVFEEVEHDDVLPEDNVLFCEIGIVECGYACLSVEVVFIESGYDAVFGYGDGVVSGM